MITVYSYAIEILTTNRTDSLQYNGANSSLQSMSTQRGLELGTSRYLCQVLFNALSGPLCTCICAYVWTHACMYICMYVYLSPKHENANIYIEYILIYLPTLHT